MAKTALTGSKQQNNSGDSEMTTKSPNIPMSSSNPHIISESHSLQITQHRLNGKGYLEWSQSVFFVIQGKDKTEYLTGKAERPDEGSPGYSQWISEKSVNCPEDSKKHALSQEKTRVFDFLYGLNKDLDEVKGYILRMRTSLNLREAFVEVRWEESHKRVMVSGTRDSTGVDQGLALATRRNDGDIRGNKRDIEKMWCDHCQRPDRGYEAVSEEVQPKAYAFSKEQLEQLQVLIANAQLNTNNATNTSQCTVAKKESVPIDSPIPDIMPNYENNMETGTSSLNLNNPTELRVYS
ncbi:hypothetical protein BUALT_Bualt10G0054300 [Buddleja alternifolia]|uniref:Retrotransposon Copia-like N-terminal domain-containing protein n=1 Tax=Buddleja alternifolia TaxID=168488 RepID=A0AAV6WXR1_9LAMI|nr:hypothetical protein BUALT_Bualt10G0054300 [Buddleja alternifolia]